MATLPIHDLSGKASGEINLAPEIFEQSAKPALLHQMVTAELANRRQGTASTKTRGEVRGGGRKPWRQKGTGRARAGTRRSPIGMGGGIVFGPKPRSYRQSSPHKMRGKALISALSARCVAGDIMVIEDLRLSEAKTGQLAKLLVPLDLPQRSLLVLAQADPVVELAARNLTGISIALPEELSAYQVLDCNRLIFTKSAVAGLEEMLS